MTETTLDHDAALLVRSLGPEDAEVFQEIRLRGLLECPQAFGSTYAEESELAIETVSRRLEPSSSPAKRVVLGAFRGGELVGIAGCFQESKVKTRHKAGVWGMYVDPRARGRGVGEALMRRLISEAREWEEVDRLTLVVSERATAARNLYERLGFRRYGFEPDAFRDANGSDAIHYLSLDLRVTEAIPLLPGSP